MSAAASGCALPPTGLLSPDGEPDSFQLGRDQGVGIAAFARAGAPT
jgi:hypothetical protein